MTDTASTLERNSHGPDGMDRVSGREAIRRREIARFVDGLRRVRAVILSVGVLVLLWLLSMEQLTWRLVTPTFVLAVFVPIIALDLYRLRRPPDPLGFASDLFLGVLGQAGVITLTGGIESPLLFVIVALPIGAATLLGPRPSSRALLATVLVLPWAWVLASAFELTPRTVIELLGLEHPHALPYAITRAAVVNLGSVVMFRLGMLLHHGVNRMLDNALEARREALESQRERNRELVYLSSAIAHELKNPLASIKGLVQLLSRGGKNAAQRFEVLEREVDRTRTVLDEFLNFSRPLGTLTVQSTNMQAMLTELSALHEGMAEDAGVRIAHPEGVAVAHVDPRKLGQALVNLLQNAIEASPTGAEVRWVLESEDGAIRVGVEDRGPGMDPSVRRRAAAVGTTTKPGGSGIGLAVARTIAEQHGGQLVIEDRAGGGCRVCLVLPKSPPMEEVAA